MIVVLPFPSSELNPNRKNGKSWKTTQTVKAKSRDDAFLLARNALQRDNLPKADTYLMRITFIQPDKRRRDLDNLLASFKSAGDGVASALGIDDSQFSRVELLRGFKKGDGHVIVEILPNE